MNTVMIGTLSELTGFGIEILVDGRGEFLCEFFNGNLVTLSPVSSEDDTRLTN